MEVTRMLARYVVNATYESLPADVVREARRSLLNWLGVAIGGCRHEAVEIALATVAEFSGPARASVLGRTERLDMLHAALINGISSHVLDFDDTHLRTVIHPSGPVAPALLALAETRPVPGKDLLLAFVLGVEVECRIGNGVCPSHYDQGWHVTATAGVFGAAAAAGKLLHLSETQMVHALGIAATQAAGLREMFGTHCKPFHPGRAAQNGLFAALLAARGFTSSAEAIEGRRGFARVMAPEYDLAEMVNGLGERFEIRYNTYKPFACGIVIHPAIDGCIQLRSAFGLSADQIERIDLRVNPLVLELTGKRAPRTGLEGKFSIYHSAAVAIIDGAAGEAQYSDARVTDPAVVALRERVHALADATVARDECRVTVTLRDGRVFTRHVQHAVGSLARPMSDDELDAKFRDLVTPILPADQAEELIRLCRSLEDLPDSAALARTAVPRIGKERM